jgi:aspartate/methionine/tyrosine aminotransferase
MSSHVSQRAQNIVRMTMADMANLADARPGAFRLENADTNLMPPEHVLEATREAVGVDRYNSYLPLHGLPELREAVAERYRRDAGLRYDADGEVVITSGAGEAMLCSLLALVNPGEKVLLTNPTYSGMAQRVRLANGVQVFTNLREEKSWHLDLEDLERKAAGCKVIFYISPSMPTGAVFTEEETRVIGETAERNDAVVVFNASLDKIVYDGRRTVNPAGLKDMKDRTITIGSVSKTYNMIGWRVGWAAGPQHLIKAVENVHIFNGIMPSGITQAGATAALTGPQEWVEEAVQAYQERRDMLVEALEKIPGISLVKPEGGYYFIANIKKLGVKSPEFCTKLLEEKNVATTPMVAWGSDDFGYDHVRFIFTNESEERLQTAGKLIQEFVQEHYHPSRE